MSAATPPSDDDVVRAGEYVLGLAEPEQAERVRADLAAGGPLALAVADWERHLAPLYALIPKANPPAALWTRLERNSVGADEAVRPRPVPAPSARVRRRPVWPATGAAFALAAAIAAVAILLRPAPPPPVAVAALLPKADGMPVIVAERHPDGDIAFVTVGPLARRAGHDYELWSLPDGARRPVALGLLRPGETVLPADHVPAGPGQILVSLEPSGGSPTGLPTGPVLSGGAYAGRT